MYSRVSKGDSTCDRWEGGKGKEKCNYTELQINFKKTRNLMGRKVVDLVVGKVNMIQIHCVMFSMNS